MCWSAEVSLQTFLSTSLFILVIYLLNPNDIFSIFFMLSFTVMQLIEYFIWRYINDKKKLYLFGFLTFFIIFLQPIILLLCIPKERYLVKYYILLQLSWLIFSYIFLQLRFIFLPYISKNKHISWNWTNNNIFTIVFVLIYLIFYLGMIYKYSHPIIFILGIVTLAYSFYNYNNYKTASSMWCWIANLLVVIFLVKALYINFSHNNSYIV